MHVQYLFGAFVYLPQAEKTPEVRTAPVDKYFFRCDQLD